MSLDLINNLPDSYVQYELQCRGKDPLNFSMRERKVVLLQILNVNRSVAPVPLSILNDVEDLATCATNLQKLEVDFGNKNNVEKISDCLTFLTERVRRVIASSPEIHEHKTQLLSACRNLQGRVGDYVVELDEQDTPPNLNLSIIRNMNLNDSHSSTASNNNNNNARAVRPNNNMSRNPFIEPQAQSSNVQIDRAIHIHRNDRIKVPVYKWGLKFSGVLEKDQMTPTEFVTRTMDYMQSRNITEEELYMSAIDLFEGTAYQWFKSLSNLGREYPRNWTELSGRLLSDFEKPDYLEDLEDHIRNRKQGKDEGVVEYFAYMEECFTRLVPRYSRENQIKIIRRNILPRYMEAIVFREFPTVDALKAACKEVEILSYRCRRAESETKQVRFNGPSAANNFSTNRQLSHAQPSVYNRRSHSPADVRNDRRWDSPINYGPQSRNSNNFGNNQNQMYANRSPPPFNRRVNSSALNSNSDRCDKCRRIGCHEPFCPNLKNVRGGSQDRSRATPN